MTDSQKNMVDEDRVPIIDEDSTTTKGGSTFGLSGRLWAILISVVSGYYLALGVSTYIIPEYIHSRIDEDYKTRNADSTVDNFTYNACLDNNSGPGYERYKYVQRETAKWQNYFSVARVTPAIFASLIWGSYSDVIGRKYLMLVCLSGTVVKTLVITLVIHFRGHIAWLFIGEVAEGVTGTFTGFLAVMFALVADVTAAGRERTIAIILSELLLGVMFAMSSFGTGYYIQYTGFFAPSLTACGCVLTSFLCTIVFLSETLSEKKPGGLQTLVVSLSTAFKLYFKPESRLVQIKYFILLLAFIFYSIQGLNRGTLETLYQLGQPFCWSATKIGWFGATRVAMLSLIGMSSVFVLKKFLADDTIAVVSCGVTTISYVVEGLAKTVDVLYTVPALSTLSLMPIPMIRSLMSRITPAEKQGAMFSTIGAFETLCSLIGSLTGNLVYAATLSIMNGFVFLILALITAISGAILGVYMCVERCYGDKQDNDIQTVLASEPYK